MAARVIKIGDGGSRPALNLHDAARVIVGVATLNRGSDPGQRPPMLAHIVARTGGCPTELLVDGGDPKHDAIDEAAAQHVTVLAPVPRPRLRHPVRPDLRHPAPHRPARLIRRADRRAG